MPIDIKNLNTPNISIFCDGGIANRFNSLVSGLALANYFKLPISIYWPVNSWCGASFNEIFDDQLTVHNLGLDKLSKAFNHASVLLHDEIASNLLDVPFESAYAYESLSDFETKVISPNKEIFFYPALIPDWIPKNLIHEELKKLSFKKFIRDEVTNYINHTFKKAFYGIHLRRTDLKLGLTDVEVMQLAQGNPDAVFFVCSDDPKAETLATAHDNVFCRAKINYVEKKSNLNDWISLTKDDEGRLNYSNINRSSNAIIDGLIDLLILSHSEIIGYSGSTFQSFARLFGEISPMVEIGRPPPLAFFSFSDMSKQVRNRLIKPADLFSICKNMSNNANQLNSLELLRLAYESYDEVSLQEVSRELAVSLLNQNQPRQARLYLKSALEIDPENYSFLVYLAFAEIKLDNVPKAKLCLEKAKKGVGHKSEGEINLELLLNNHINSLH